VRQVVVSSTEFVEFYTRTKDRSVGVVAALGLRPDEAEEAVAEAYVRAWSRWQKIRTMNSPEAWIVRTAVNANISWWRKRRRESPHETLPESTVVDGTDRPDLVAALRRLPPRQRDVVVLRYLLDLDTKQTASQLGISVGTVTSQLHRGLAALRSQLTHPEGISR
jgi:RNA polymerase sigma-70 factor (sigma-E family)